MQSTEKIQPSWLDSSPFAQFKLNWETVFFTLLIAAAILTRFYDLESRVMSHDETSHTYFSWLLETGKGYQHDPVTHGPFQFHIVGLSYFLFGDSDTSARIPAVLFGIATIAFTWFYRRYLGRVGAWIAGLLILISPFALFYARYVRNEAFVGLFLVVTFWAVLRYLETGEKRYMYFLTLATVMHYASKETAFIQSAILLLFIGFYFLYRITSKQWQDPGALLKFLGLLIVCFLFIGGALGYHEFVDKPKIAADALAMSAVPASAVAEGAKATDHSLPLPMLILLGGAGLSLVGALYFLVQGYGIEQLRSERSFSIMLVQFTLIAPLLTPFIMNFAGITIPNNASQVAALTLETMIPMAIIIIFTTGITFAAGLFWNPREYAINAAIFWSIFTVLYTTFFTNGAGFFTGVVGSLGYWLSQQDVNRGSQPLYYYAFVQLPIYEFVAILGVILAASIRIYQAVTARLVRPAWDRIESGVALDQEEPAPTFAFLAFWSVASLAAFSVAGEKMPWLTYHIALPMILLSAWGLGILISSTNWKALLTNKAWLALAIFPVFAASLASSFSLLFFSPTAPFAGKSLDQLSVTSTFLLAAGAAVICAFVLIYLLKEWSFGQISRLFITVVMCLAAVIQARSAFRASYVNYDSAAEYLVYAHCAPGIKIALEQIEEISRRTTGSLDMVVAYDNETTYPYWWYLRNFTNQRYFGSQPTREQLKDAPVILVGDANYAKIDAIVGQNYDKFDYIRIWWPNQDYMDITWERFKNAITNRELRSSLFDIWLNRDYRAYASINNNQSLTQSNWSPSARFRLYVRKDISAKIWNFGTAPVAQIETSDPYEGKSITLQADLIIGGPSSELGLNRPRGVAVAPDGSLYIADSANNRIVHMDTKGNILHSWGTFADSAKSAAPGGTFFEPWSVAVGLDGSVFVADTWNHRIQKFSADGTFIKMWGVFGQAETPIAFWGPRTVVIDPEYRVYVMDTGNKRIVVFDKDGNYITEFGTTGSLAGQFDEPVGLALDNNGNAFVADTWNQRIQVFAPASGGLFNPIKEWTIAGWYGQSLDNKPYLVFGPKGHLFASDPDGFRILEFDSEGKFIRFWGDLGGSADRFNLPNGLAYDNLNGIWVADSGNNRILHFEIP